MRKFRLRINCDLNNPSHKNILPAKNNAGYCHIVEYFLSQDLTEVNAELA